MVSRKVSYLEFPLMESSHWHSQTRAQHQLVESVKNVHQIAHTNSRPFNTMSSLTHPIILLNSSSLTTAQDPEDTYLLTWLPGRYTLCSPCRNLQQNSLRTCPNYSLLIHNRSLTGQPSTERSTLIWKLIIIPHSSKILPIPQIPYRDFTYQRQTHPQVKSSPMQ